MLTFVASRRLGVPLALSAVLALALLPDHAFAAALKTSVGALGVLALFAAMLLMREWPIALTGSIWAAGTLFAAALWFLRTRYRPEWLSSTLSPRIDVPVVRPAVPVMPRAGNATAVASDPEEVLAAARQCFLDLQAAWDAGDIDAMRSLTTEEMLDELLQQLPMRGPGPNRTDVVTLEAALLGLESIGPRCIASVEFSGMIRESSDRGAVPFKELWMLTRLDGEACGWRLARHQALL